MAGNIQRRHRGATDARLHRHAGGHVVRRQGAAALRLKLAGALLWLMGLAAAALPGRAQAWGPDGHALVAELAESQLTPQARARVASILALEPGATLASVSGWADDERSPETARWHYVNLPRDASCVYRASRDCPEGRCVVGAIEAQAGVLASGSAEARAKLDALKFLVHLVADVHQPLHAAFADDRGGNTYQVQAFARGSNLHAVWDSALIRHWPGGLPALKLAVESRAADLRGTPADWAQESCRIASRPGFYPEERHIERDYLDAQGPTLVSRLRQASDRLAELLNRVLTRP